MSKGDPTRSWRNGKLFANGTTTTNATLKVPLTTTTTAPAWVPSYPSAWSYPVYATTSPTITYWPELETADEIYVRMLDEALDEFFDASLSPGQRMTPLFDERRMGRQRNRRGDMRCYAGSRGNGRWRARHRRVRR